VTCGFLVLWVTGLRTNPGSLSGPVPHVRTVKTAPGATAGQIVYSYHRGSRDIGHIRPAHDGTELEFLKAVARQRLAAGQGVLDLGPGLRRRGRAAHRS
jgi:hypothetical protein